MSVPESVRFLRFLEACGIPWRHGPWGRGSGYGIQAESLEDLVHEVAHIVIATTERCATQWYGLGPPTAISNRPAFAHHEESKVSLLGLVFLAHFGAPDKNVLAELLMHGWKLEDGHLAYGYWDADLVIGDFSVSQLGRLVQDTHEGITTLRPNLDAIRKRLIRRAPILHQLNRPPK